MFFIMAVTLYTSRVILQILGVQDYGIFNVVGGAVAMMGMFNSAMSSATTRYLTFELGRGDQEKLNKTFSVSCYIYLVIGAVFVLLAETIGVWFLNNKLTIPIDRIEAANWIFQFVIISVLFTLFHNPFNASIIAHEKMGMFAYISILETILRLAIVFMLSMFSYDKLILYGFLYMLTSMIIFMIYFIYCRAKFTECRIRYYKDLSLFKEIFAYSGWNLFGSVAGFVRGQGLNILINMFFNPSVNAARGIAYQVNAAITQFVNNFYIASKPQITKYYAVGEQTKMENLVFISSKVAFLLMIVLALPIIVEAPYIIQVWLGQTPEYVIPFVRIIILISTIDGLSSPLMTVAHATGRIALYQSVVGGMQILNIPISYILLSLGHGPVIVFYVSLIIAIICLFTRLWICKYLCNFPFFKYSFNVIGKAAVISILSYLPVYLLSKNVEESFSSFLFVFIVCELLSISLFYLIGLNKHEKVQVHNIVNKIIIKIRRS